MKRVVFLFLFLGSALRGEAPETFFPMKQGTTWVYSTVHKQEKESFEMKVFIEGPWKGDSLEGMIMTQKDKRGTMRQFLLKKDQGIFIHKLALSKALTPEVNTRFTPALPAIIFPFTPGNKVHWEGRLKIAWVDKPIIFDGEVIGWEDLTTPAGKFHCIKLHFHEKRGNDVIDEDVWYAEGVGQVRYDGAQYVKELKEFKKPS